MPQGLREPQALLQRHRPSTGHGNPAEVLCAEVPASNWVKDDQHEARTKTICIGGELQTIAKRSQIYPNIADAEGFQRRCSKLNDS